LRGAKLQKSKVSQCEDGKNTSQEEGSKSDNACENSFPNENDSANQNSQSEQFESTSKFQKSSLSSSKTSTQKFLLFHSNTTQKSIYMKF